MGEGKSGRGPYVAEGGAPFTYPDLQSTFVAAVNANAEVLIQSYYRPWTFDKSLTFDPADAKNEKWLKYLQLHPHTKYHTQFTTPDADPGGHVKNLDWARGVPRWDAASGKKAYCHLAPKTSHVVAPENQPL